MSVQLVSKISNLCDPDPPTSQTDRRTDGQHAISIPRYALVHRAVKIGPFDSTTHSINSTHQIQQLSYQVETVRTIYVSVRNGRRTLFCRMLTSLYDENKLKFKNVSTECLNDSRKQLHFYRIRTLFRKRMNIWSHLHHRIF